MYYPHSGCYDLPPSAYPLYPDHPQRHQVDPGSLLAAKEVIRNFKDTLTEYEDAVCSKICTNGGLDAEAMQTLADDYTRQSREFDKFNLRFSQQS